MIPCSNFIKTTINKSCLVKYLSTQTKESKTPWKSVVGLEIHAQINSNTKLFSGAKLEFGSLVNNCVSYFDASIPGTLPVLNKRCVEAGVLTALALSCEINPISTFDRKHYFYADLPAGYQITQQRAPIAQNGKLKFQVFNPNVHKKPYYKESVIKQIQLEQDSGKSLHDEIVDMSLVDLNRAGCPLMELVFEPDLEDGEEAASLVNELLLIFTRLGCCNCKMEEGALRADANVSIHLPGEPFGMRTEIKNIGSARGIAEAIKYEINRQIDIRENGDSVINETLAWDAISKKTISMRDKESKQDYRYMPEPNLPPLILNMTDEEHPDLVSVPNIKKQLPELPEDTRQRLMDVHGFSRDIAVQMVYNENLQSYFFDLVKDEKRSPKVVGNLLMIELLGVLNKKNILIADCKLTSEIIGEIVDLKQADKINLFIVRKIYSALLDGETKSPTELIKINDWGIISDDAELEKICLRTLEENPKMVKDYKRGKKQVLKAIMGVIKSATNARVHMAATVKKLEELLSK